MNGEDARELSHLAGGGALWVARVLVHAAEAAQARVWHAIGSARGAARPARFAVRA